MTIGSFYFQSYARTLAWGLVASARPADPVRNLPTTAPQASRPAGTQAGPAKT